MMSVDPIQAYDTLRMEVRGADGKIKPVWQENTVGTWLLANGFIPASWHIPGLGKWQAYKEVGITWL